jgi:2'-5' RNA ligase
MAHHSADLKRLFFALGIAAPWPEEMPSGRMLLAGERHLTLAFLGNADWSSLQAILPEIPPPPFIFGAVGKFDKAVALPERHPRVMAWHVDWQMASVAMNSYQQQIAQWLSAQGFSMVDSKRPWLPHVTICRQPFDCNRWLQAFRPLPLVAKGLFLYESVGDLRYRSLWDIPFQMPFLEIDHTADLAYVIYGHSIEEIYRHAQCALNFAFPELPLTFNALSSDTLDGVIAALNSAISHADVAVGASCKAVSYHGQLCVNSNQILSWEMIIDV